MFWKYTMPFSFLKQLFSEGVLELILFLFSNAFRVYKVKPGAS